MFTGVWINIQAIDLSPSVNLSVSTPIPRCMYHYCSSIIELDVRDGDASGGYFFIQDYSCYPGFFGFPYEVEYCSFKGCEELCWDFDGHCFEFIDCLW